MSHRKIAIVILFSFLTSICYGQTKSETVGWLKENLRKYITTTDPSGNVTGIKITECFIAVEFSDSEGLEFTIHLHTKGLTFLKDGFTQTGEILELVNKEEEYFDPVQKTIYLREVESGFLQKAQKYVERLSGFCSKN